MKRHFSILSLTCSLTTILMLGTAQVAWSSFEDQIDKIAESVTVRIDGDGVGSGVIIKKKGNVYTVITSCHLVSKTQGNQFVISTVDKQKYPITADKGNCEGKADLAELQFTSNQTYQVVEIEQPTQLSKLMTIYVSGWVGTSPYSTDEKGRSYRLRRGKINNIDLKANEGYQIVHDAESSPGMSGGPVFNDQGKLIGINGQARPQPTTENLEFFAIPISVYTAWRGKIAKTSPPMGCDDFSQRLMDEGDEQRLQSNYIAAFDFYRQATEHSPQCYQAWYYKARTLLSLEQDEEAISSFYKALAIQPNEYSTWCEMGKVLLLLSRLKEAEASYKKAITIEFDASKSNPSCKILSNHLGVN